MRTLQSQGEGPAGLYGWRLRWHETIYGTDTPAGKAFDVVLIGAILLSTAVVLLESVSAIRARHADLLVGLEWAMTLLFTVEYGMRLLCVSQPARYARSFFGVVDLVSILPTFASLVLPEAQVFAVVPLLRVLRLVRILKLARYVA